MKKITKYILSLTALSAALFSCRNEEAVRFPDFKDAANVRIQVDPDFSYFDFSDIANARLKYDVFSENTNLDEVNIYFVYTPAVGSASDPILIKTYTQADFSAAKGAIRNEEITSADVTSALGITVADLAGGDQFVFLNYTTMADGTVYPSESLPGFVNVDPGFDPAAGTASFTTRFNAIVGCPLEAAFTGTYALEQIAGPNDPFFGFEDRWTAANVTLTATNPIARRFLGTYLTFDSRAFNFTLLCGAVSVPKTSSGLSCGGPSIAWVSDPNATFQYNPADDSEIIIEILDNVDPACGIAQNEPLTLRLTKQ